MERRKRMDECAIMNRVFYDMCENVMSDRKTTDASVKILYDKVKRLEADLHTLNETNQKLNDTVFDLQFRCMRDNLMFTRMEEPDYSVDQHEDTI